MKIIAALIVLLLPQLFCQEKPAEPLNTFIDITSEIKPEYRIAKEKANAVLGVAETTVKADKIHYHFYIQGADQVVSSDSKDLGQILALRDSAVKVEKFKKDFAWAFPKKIDYTIEADDDIYIKISTEIQGVKERADSVTTLEILKETDTTWKTSTIRKNIKIYYHILAFQKVNLTTENKYSEGILKQLENSGAAFGEKDVKLSASNLFSQLFYDQELAISADDQTSTTFSLMEDKTKRASKEFFRIFKREMENGGYDESYGVQGDESNITYSLSIENRKLLENEVLAKAINNAKRKSEIISRCLDIKVRNSVPIIENTFAYSVARDYSGSIILKGKILFYY